MLMASGKRSALLKYNFQLGEVVLCFEPDPTKARVLYDAKILETSHLKAKSGQPMPAYRIHFQGWNSSWDRTVGENYILKSSEENRRLMKKLAETAKCYRNNRLRKIKINDILDKAFRHKPLVFDFEADVDDDDDDDSDSSDSCYGRNVQNGNSNKNESSDDDSEEEIDVELTIPKVLREKLEEDFLMINRRNKLLRLPAEPNIISVLEGYVKNFSINVLYGLSDRWKLVADNKNSSMDIKSIPMCREVVDGIRICFDFTLPTVLLYSFEKDQFSRFMNQHCNYSNGEKTSSSFSQTPNSCAQTTSRRKNRKPRGTRVPKLSRKSLEKSHLNTENSIDSDGLDASEMMTAFDSTPTTTTASPPGRPYCRRVTRQYLAETSKSFCELKPRTRPGMRGRGRGRWKFRDSGFKRQTEQKLPGRGGCRGRRGMRGRRGRRGRRSLVCSNRQGFGPLGVFEDPKMDFSMESPSLQKTQELEAEREFDFDVIKAESSFETTAMSTTNGCSTPTSAMFTESFSASVLTTPPVMSTNTATNLTGTSSQGCLFSTPLPMKSEEGVQSVSSSSGPHPHHLTMFNPCQAPSSISSMPRNMDSDKGWPYHNLVQEVFHTPASQSRIDEILTWKLSPTTVYSNCPPQPSHVCGPHQLLRLFVKLPELLSRMDLPDMKLNILVNYLENFLEYLASRHEDLFPLSAYVDAV